jgi:methylenetetrahydrofolate dehydrogenase (NADP+)/methenyltetrahydrofolate cyclohydrolase
MPNMCGIIAQLPLPEHIDKRAVLDAIDSRLDVDCLGSKTSSEFYMGNSKIGFPTALACMAVLDSISLDLSSKNVLVMGQGDLVGKPVTALLKARGVVAHTITRSTEGKEELMKNADVIISGMGQGKYITGDMVKQGAVIVDAGTSEENSAIVGDVDFESVSKVASHISPVPGGVGPVTVAMLLKNVLTVAKNR